MHRVFGIKDNAEYLDREGAYLIPCRNNQVGVVQTPKGYFFLGGGIENGESHFCEALKGDMSVDNEAWKRFIMDHKRYLLSKCSKLVLDVHEMLKYK